MTGARIVVESGGRAVCSAADRLVIGGRTGVDLVLDDPLLADRHCEIEAAGAFTLRDLGSVTGTWLDGATVRSATELRDGAQIVLGLTRIGVKVEPRDGRPALVLDLQRNAFWFRKPGKGVFDNDPDLWVRTEVDFGRFPALLAANRVAAAAAIALLLAALLFAFAMEPLADAGPLLAPHAVLVQGAGGGAPAAATPEFARRRGLAADQGCDVCHTTGAGAPESKCLQCHQDLAAEATWRHPYLGDGKLGPTAARAADESFCTECHTDHQAPTFLKPGALERVGDCKGCHGEAKAPPPVAAPPQRDRKVATYVFPHDAHVGKGIACDACHRLDPDVGARRAAGLGDDPSRDDFADVPFEICATCHVPGAPRAETVPAARLEEWRAEESRWPVAWHGTDDGGRHCAACHAQKDRGGRTVFGPELRQVERLRLSAEAQAELRGRYVRERRRHETEFAAHAGDRACSECHREGQIATADAAAARTFWHALHLAADALAPRGAAAGAVSKDAAAGCASCHVDIGEQTALRPAAQGAFAWPGDAAAQLACKPCHSDGDRQLSITAAPQPAWTAEQRAPAADFPHDVHTGHPSFGASGALADGCFACHEFAVPAGGSAFHAVPRTKAGVADCTRCHAGHANVGGGHCQKCHPADAERSNSFLLSAGIAAGEQVAGRRAPAAPTRRWPEANAFSHLSPGHAAEGIACDRCHDAAGTKAAETLAEVPVPDEAAPSCRECHLRQQFHWR